MDALGVVRPNISPRASGHIPEQIELIKALLEKGYAYETEEGEVYFAVERFPEYGKLSGRKVEELEPGARVAVREEKRHPADFALWKRADPEHILRWPSPWGWGFPGWHAECSAMATKYLGDTFDIHGGGLENIFPHNECEIAQSEAATGKPMARYWVLVGSLTVNGVKMSKSLGNFLTIKDALKLYSPEAIRFFILSGHYRGPMDFSRDAVLAAERGVERLHQTVRLVQSRMKGAPSAGTAELSHVAHLTTIAAQVVEAMDDDFNTPQAIAALFDLNKNVNDLLNSGQELSQGTLTAINDLYSELGGQILGIIPDGVAQDTSGELVKGLMEIILDIRHQYRAGEEWEQADALRQRLIELGVVVEDRPEGPTWRLERGGE
jgi:cysteinyl-tRNA synthetase